LDFLLIQLEGLENRGDRGDDKAVIGSERVDALGKLEVFDDIKVLVVLVHVKNLNPSFEICKNEKVMFEFREEFGLVFFDPLKYLNRFECFRINCLYLISHVAPHDDVASILDIVH
jgi:hypothetical protein